MLKTVDKIAHVKTPSGRHIGPSLKLDFEMVLKVLLEEELLKTKEGRIHKHLSNFVLDPFISLKKPKPKPKPKPTLKPAPKPAPYEKFHKWLLKRRRAASIQQNISLKVY